jgi:hypothetical protein
VSEFAAIKPQPNDAQVIFVYQGTDAQGPMFFEALHAEAVAIADPNGELYHAFSVERGGVREMFGLQPWLTGIRAFFEGNFINRKIGDPWTLPSLIGIRDNRIVWEFRGTHAGDHPDITALRDELRELA